MTRIIGLALLILGSMLLYTGIQGSPGDNKLMGMILVPGGLLFLLSSSTLSFDPLSRKLTERSGIWLLFRRKAYDFSQFQSVLLATEIRQVNRRTVRTFTVRLKGEGIEILRVQRHRSYLPARRTAETAAKLLGIKMIDSAHGSEVVRSPELLDRSILEELAGKGAIPEPSESDASPRLRWKQESGGHEFMVGSPGIRRGEWSTTGWTGTLGLVFLFVTGKRYFIGAYKTDSFHPDRPKYILVSALFGMIGFVAVLGPLIWSAFGKERIRVERQNIRFSRTLFLFGRTKSFPLSGIEELGLQEQELYIRGDRIDFTFGRGLSKSDRNWLLGALRYSIANVSS